ncbi:MULTISPECIES: hypothetical protein [Streptosporangiaceae]|uniref:hypothetical protein n=1 Tax=Streptosporangiaceae TaxID=2004 RepID=UPI003407C515
MAARTVLAPDHPECIALARRIAVLEQQDYLSLSQERRSEIHRLHLALEAKLRPLNASHTVGFSAAAALIREQAAAVVA